MTTLRLPGHSVPNDTHDVAALGEYLDIEVLGTQEVIGVVRGEALRTADLENVREDDLIELRFDGGVTQWTTVAQLREEAPAARAADGDVLHVPVQFTRGTTQRGLWDWVLRGARVLRIDPAGKLADLGQAEIVDHFESRQQPPPALYRVGEKGELANPVTNANPLPGGPAPWLVFIHGTASSTDGSFGKMFGTQEYRDLRAKYGDRILALQHKTLSVSPATNAIDLATLLPVNAVVHLVTQSRGGLIGELLCIPDFGDAALDVFRKTARNADIAQLRKLRTLLRAKKLSVEKFVRVACPARGTILASRRLDLYFSVILNLLGRLLMPANPLYALFKATALALIKRRTMADQLPGLEAMMPESPLVHFLNKGLATQADLGVIAGDVEGDTFLTRLKVFAIDLYYLQEHDLVINTSAMFGGMGRPAGAYGFFDKGATVDHFSYFANQKTRARIYGWLTAPKGTPDPAFTRFDPRVGGIPIDPARGERAILDTTRAAAVIVPDVFGTLLERNGEVLWPDVAAIARNGLETLAADKALTATALVDKVYGPLVAGLDGATDPRPFAYDWRRSLEESAAQLAKFIEALGDREVSIVAHGSGGLVVRTLIARQTGTWKQLTQNGGRALLLGAPLAGTFAAVQWCSGRSRLARMLALADGSPAADVGAWFRTLPGIVELVPDTYLTEKAWRDNGIPPPDAALLARAKALRDDLEQPLPGNVLTVVGRDTTTPTPVAFDADPLDVQVTREGDGRVTLDSAAPSAETWRVEAPHGELAAYAGAFTAYLELLRTGKTARLRSAHGTSFAPEAVRDEANAPLLFPTSEDLAAEAFLLRGTGDARRDYPLAVSVTHGDLRFVHHPVVVGHYQGDPIVSAEAVLDRRLGRRLSRRFQTGLYPGPADTVEVIRAPKSNPPGALIIGLGHVGSVTPEIIRRGVAAATLRYALQVAEEEGGGAGAVAGWHSAAISAVLLGTNGGNAISIEDSIAAVIRGVLDANRALRRQDLWRSVRIDTIDFIELYEQRAIDSVYAAQRAANRMSTQLEPGEHVDVNPILRSTTTPSGQFTRPPSASQTGWWQRMFVTAAKETSGDTALKYVVIAERARAEATLQCREQKLTQLLIEQAVKSAAFNRGISGALFELLVPVDIKNAAANVPNVVITLDPTAAQIPWEILSDPTAPAEEKPFSVKTGLLRQLIEGEYRGDPRSAELRTAFVVGDTTSGFAPLYGAREEAAAVAKVIEESQYAVTHRTAPDPTTLITELFARPYRVLHIAAHGAYNAAKPAESGVVLDGPRGIFLSACQLRQLRTVPDLVFINCCFLGTIDSEPRPHLLAASVAEELIKMGVRAVIAAGWAVDDAAAVTFASSFYDAMLRERRSFGDAVRWARDQVYTKHPSTNTWAAYQCYGNPGFLLAGIGERAPSGPRDAFCTPGEYIDLVRSLEATANASGEDSEDQKHAREALAEFDAQLPDRWRNGELLARLGYAWRAVGDLDRAIDNFAAALEREDASAPIHAAERLWDVLCRRAEDVHDAGGDPKKVRELVTHAEELSDWLTVLPSTANRWNLQGKNYWRLARIATDLRKADGLLRKAADAFRKSADLRSSPSDGSGLYSRRNAILIDWLLDPKDATVRRELAEIEPIIRSTARTGDFWDRAGEVDLELLRGLVKGQVDPEHISQRYRDTLTPNDRERARKAAGEYVAWILKELNRHERSIPRGLEDLVSMLTGTPLRKRPSRPRKGKAKRPLRKPRP